MSDIGYRPHGPCPCPCLCRCHLYNGFLRSNLLSWLPDIVWALPRLSENCGYLWASSLVYIFLSGSAFLTSYVSYQ